MTAPPTVKVNVGAKWPTDIDAKHRYLMIYVIESQQIDRTFIFFSLNLIISSQPKAMTEFQLYLDDLAQHDTWCSKFSSYRLLLKTPIHRTYSSYIYVPKT